MTNGKVPVVLVLCAEWRMKVFSAFSHIGMSGNLQGVRSWPCKVCVPLAMNSTCHRWSIGSEIPWTRLGDHLSSVWPGIISSRLASPYVGFFPAGLSVKRTSQVSSAIKTWQGLAVSKTSWSGFDFDFFDYPDERFLRPLPYLSRADRSCKFSHCFCVPATLAKQCCGR
jgi:hypothetical protein